MKTGTCKHFNGIANDKCRAEVNYKELCGGVDGFGAKLPCVPNSPFLKGEPVKCDKFIAVTEEEHLAWQKACNEKFDLISQAIKRICETKKQTGTVECPKCKAKLHFSISTSNGHIMARCETNNCLGWIE